MLLSFVDVNRNFFFFFDNNNLNTLTAPQLISGGDMSDHKMKMSMKSMACTFKAHSLNWNRHHNDYF